MITTNDSSQLSRVSSSKRNYLYTMFTVDRFAYIYLLRIYKVIYNHISDVMVTLLASRTVDRGFKPRSSQIKDYKIGICYSFDKPTALKRKSKDWLAQ